MANSVNAIDRVLNTQLLQFSKYSATGDIKDINALTLNLSELRDILKTAITAGYETGFEDSNENRMA